MKRTGLLVFLGCVLGLIVGGVSVWQLASARTQATAAASDAQLREVKQELTQLKRAIRDSRPAAPVAIVPMPTALTPTPSPATEPSPPGEPPIASGEEFQALMKTRQEEAAQKRRARRERIDRTLQGETRDSRWANEATKTIQGWMGEPGLAGADLKEVDCRTSICRAHISLPEGKRVDDFILTTMDKMGTFQTTSLHIVDNDGSRREFVAYLGRQGQPLPQ